LLSFIVEWCRISEQSEVADSWTVAQCLITAMINSNNNNAWLSDQHDKRHAYCIGHSQQTRAHAEIHSWKRLHATQHKNADHTQVKTKLRTHGRTSDMWEAVSEYQWHSILCPTLSQLVTAVNAHTVQYLQHGWVKWAVINALLDTPL